MNKRVNSVWISLFLHITIETIELYFKRFFGLRNGISEEILIRSFIYLIFGIFDLTLDLENHK